MGVFAFQYSSLPHPKAWTLNSPSYCICFLYLYILYCFCLYELILYSNFVIVSWEFTANTFIQSGKKVLFFFFLIDQSHLGLNKENHRKTIGDLEQSMLLEMYLPCN